MIEGLFVLVVSVTDMPTDIKYIGTFVNCEQAHLYMDLNIPEAKESRCILEQFMYLPDNFQHNYIEVHDGT